jgi:hypothetical protein
MKHISATARMDAECAGGKLITDPSFSRMVRCSSSLLDNGWEADWRQRRSKRIADLSKEREHA